MFAIAIWNDTERTLFLARDRVGEKPLYYYQDRDRLLFASEIKAILVERSVPRVLNTRGLANFLALGHAAAPETIYRDIHKLLPGHFLVAKAGRVQIARYWDVGEGPELADDGVCTDKEYARRVVGLLEDSVRRRMVADVPLGAFLSGGVDSSTIVALMRRYTDQRVKTFSLGFGIGGTFNELRDARRVADHFDTDHHELRIDHLDLVQTLRALVYHYDEPFGDAAGFPIYLLGRFAREHVKVVLCGDGGDELFGGYRRYATDQLARAYQFLPDFLIGNLIPRAVKRLPRFRRLKQALRTLPIGDPAQRYASWLVVFAPEMQDQLLNPEVCSMLSDYDPLWPYPHYYHGFHGSRADDHLNRIMYVDLKSLLADGYMEKTDKATMAWGLEARLPILDHRLVELAFQIPGRLKIRGWKTKRIFKMGIRDLIPNWVLHKPKHGLAVPTDLWFRDDLKLFAYEVLLDGSTRRRGYFNPRFVERLWREHTEGRHVWNSHLWLLLNFELWHRIYMDKEAI
jgi:asparagine synthase (glutamine-hydrolysing)